MLLSLKLCWCSRCKILRWELEQKANNTYLIQIQIMPAVGPVNLATLGSFVVFML